MSVNKHKGFDALTPFFAMIEQALAGLADGDQFFDLFTDDVIFEYPYAFLGFSSRIEGRAQLISHFGGYGDILTLDRMGDLIVHRSNTNQEIDMPNVLFIGAISLGGSFFMSYQLGAAMINFGALFAFMSVNAAAFVRYFLCATNKSVAGFLSPVLGFIICFLLWINVGRTALIAGGLWLIAGILFSAVKTNGFRTILELSEPR